MAAYGSTEPVICLPDDEARPGGQRGRPAKLFAKQAEHVHLVVVRDQEALSQFHGKGVGSYFLGEAKASSDDFGIA